MKRTWVQLLFISAAATVCLLWMAGCGELSESYESGNSTAQTVQPTPTPTATPEPTPTPVATPSQPISTLPPGIREEARFYADLDGDGKDETIVVSSSGIENGWGDWMSLEVMNKPGCRVTFTDYPLVFSKAFLTWTQNGQPCILISCYGEDAYDITYVCSFDGLMPVLRCEMYERVQDISGTSLTMYSWVETIGDWWYTREYELADDFTLKPVSDMMIDTQDREPLLTIRDVPVEMLVDGTYRADTLPAETSVYPVSADGEGHMSFRLKDGSAGRIAYTQDEYYGYAMIGGVVVDEYFDNIEYWG